MEKLINYFLDKGRVAVALSGGVDSAFLAVAASRALEDDALAITVDSAVVPRREVDFSRRFCEEHGIEHVVVGADVFSIPGFAQNEGDRCYLCKGAIMRTVLSVADARGFDTVVDGTNADDAADDRPGMRALSELNIESPLRRLGYTKERIRALAREMGLECAAKPSASCLATRIPSGTPITREALALVERSEDFLHDIDVAQVRVRVEGTLARIETTPEYFPRVISCRAQIDQSLREAGFERVCLDLRGYAE